jgi:membrane fusion protein, heavy metal efflux system
MKRLSLVILLAALAVPPLAAHEGHDHGDEKKALPNLGNTPQRLPDGTVFLPKTAQRQIGVRTLPVAGEQVPRTLELPGKVIMDPQRGGRVQAMIAGRIEAAGPQGLPVAGQRVRRGEVLARVVPSAGQLERAGQAAQVAELKAARQLAERRLARLQELSDTVPRREIEAAESDVLSLNGRIAALGDGLAGRDALLAPVDGVIAASNAVLGQVVEARELVFEIVAPDSLHVEALAYETFDLGAVAAASLAVGEQSLALQLVGASRRLREQALPLVFASRATGAGLRLPLGQPVKLQVALRETLTGLPLPQRVLVRSPANETMVWVKTAPERFAPRPVRTQPLDGARVLVVSGLVAGERVVVDGAALLNQIR